MSGPRTISRCRICGNENLTPILDLGRQVLTGRFMRPGEPDPICGPLRIVLCQGDDRDHHCGLLQLSHSYDLNEMYGETYSYRSSLSRAMVDHLGNIVARAVDIAKPVLGDAVLDIGCNDGTLLRGYESMGLARFGVDPSSEKFRSEFPADIRLLVDFFSASALRQAFGNRRFKIVTSIAMFYDLDDPMSFMRQMRDLIDDDGVWITEQAHMASMLKNLAFDSVCHEHLNYYNLAQIEWMARRCGLKLLDVELNTINGASFCVTLARHDSYHAVHSDRVDLLLSQERASGFDTLTPYETFAGRIAAFRTRVKVFFKDTRAAGELVLGYGASTKGNVVIQHCGLTTDDMPAIAEKYPLKFGLETPGSRIPIISEDEARARDPDYFFVFPWHFREEIIERERDYLQAGGALVFALPRFEIVRAVNRVAWEGAPKPRSIPWARPCLFGEERRFVRDAIDSTYISGGPYVDRFEREFADLHGDSWTAISTSNGTSALYLAFLGLGIGPGDEVVVPGWCFAAAANMALACGAKPVFVDVEDGTWLLNSADVARCVTSRTRAIVAVHTYGNLCDMAGLSAIARMHRVALIEDCAESLFSRRFGALCGTFGDVATFSFQATKTITCGEGGLVLARDPELADRMRLIRNHGMTPDRKYWHHVVGHNFRLTNMQAAMLCAQFQQRDEIIEMRDRVYQGYRQRLSGIEGLCMQRFDSEVAPVVWAVGLRLSPDTHPRSRDEIIVQLAEDGIECRPGFYAASQQSIYAAAPLTFSESVATETIVPPTPPDLADDDLDYICGRLLAALE